jgi:hypothetical protein
MTPFAATALQWKHPSKDLITTIGLSEHQWLSLKRSILISPHQYSTSHHPLVTPMLVGLSNGGNHDQHLMVWYPLLDKLMKYPIHDDSLLQAWTLTTSRSYRMTPLLPSHNNIIHSHQLDHQTYANVNIITTATRETNNNESEPRYTVGERLAWAIGCTEEQFVYMATQSDNQQLLSILDQHLLHFETIGNGNALLIMFGKNWAIDQHEMIWYAPVNIVLPIFPYLSFHCEKRATWAYVNVKKMSVDECKQWIGHIGWMGHDKHCWRRGDHLLDLSHSRDRTFSFRRIHDGEVVTLIPPPMASSSPPPSSSPSSSSMGTIAKAKEQEYIVRYCHNGRRLALIDFNARVAVVYEVDDIVTMKLSTTTATTTTTTAQPSSRILSLPWLTRLHPLIWLENYWLSKQEQQASLYALDGRHIYTWDDARHMIAPDDRDNDGYFLVSVANESILPSNITPINKGYRLYAYNIAKVVATIASLTSLPSATPSRDYMLSIALASWPLDDINDEVIWLSIPNHEHHQHSDGMIAIRSQRNGKIRIYSVPSSCSSSSQHQQQSPNDSSARAARSREPKGKDRDHVAEAKNGNGNGNDDVVGSTKLYEMKPNDDNGWYSSLESVPVLYDYDMNEIILEFVTLALMSNEVGWTLTPLIALVLSYLLE